MGSVASLALTGDNDPELTPTKYFRHILYCDGCGSFDIKVWIEPENHLRLARNRQTFSKIGVVFLIGFIISCLLMLASVVQNLLWGSPLLGTDAMTLFVISLIGMFGTGAVTKFLSSKIRYRGLRCGACNAEYKAESSFGKDLDANPKNFTMADVPATNTYWVRGKNVDDSELGEQPQRISRLPA